VTDLQPSAQEQVRAGLPSGNRADAQSQMIRLIGGDLLPRCESIPTTTTATPTAPPVGTAVVPTTEAAPPVPGEPVPPVATTTPTPTPTPTGIPGQTCRTVN
jgi:protein phosphatase